ncbi:MAG: MFS transporter, partial [Candidatus Hydrogenedentes bacterium]|nr:MFS transporter [Candidatus Hydrogenedentota bacterium]
GPVVVFAGFSTLRVPALVHEDAERTPLRHLLVSVGFLAGLAVIFLAGAAEQGIVQWLPAYTERGLGYSKAAGGMTLAAYSVLMIAGRMLAAVVARRVRAVPLMRGACALLTACILIACFAPRGMALAACVLTGWAVSCLWPTTLGLVADRFPHGGASMFALLAGLGNSGCIVMPWVIGFVAEHSRLNMGLAVTALCPILIIGLLAAIRR